MEMPSEEILLKACRSIWEDCLDRRGIKHEFFAVSGRIRDLEIIPAWMECIKKAIAEPPTNGQPIRTQYEAAEEEDGE